MISATFTAHALATAEQFEAWRGWYASVFEVTAPASPAEGFSATNTNWTLNGLTVSRVSSPAYSVDRTKSFIRRNPVDHWAITLSKHSASDVEARDVSVEAPPGVPFFLSLGAEMRITRRRQEDRVQLLLSRDRFTGIGQILDAVRGTTLDTPQGRLLADYTLLLERNLPNLGPDDAARLPKAIEGMLAACLAPSADRMAEASRQVDLTLMERVRRAVRKHLRSSSLGPDRLCREAATSRSQLYRLLESEGGVAHYIQRRRLSESFAILGDASNKFPITAIAEALCFADASNFSRAFRREFGMTPSDVRSAAQAGLAPAAAPRSLPGSAVQSFGDCLRGF